MVADTSALIAMLMEEPDAQVYFDAVSRNRPVLVSSPLPRLSFLIVALGKGADAYRGAITMLEGNDIELVPLDYEQALAAGEANRRYGKGRHPAALNFGDTFAYALASVRQSAAAVQGQRFCAGEHHTGGLSLAMEHQDKPFDRITMDPAACMGKARVRGTRITVEFVLKLLRSGCSIDEIVHDYPELTDADINQCAAIIPPS